MQIHPGSVHWLFKEEQKEIQHERRCLNLKNTFEKAI